MSTSKVRSARLAAKGGLGAPDRTLELVLDVPAIAELLPAVGEDAGVRRAALSATARGEWAAPEIQVRASAEGLRYGDHAVAGARQGELRRRQRRRRARRRRRLTVQQCIAPEGAVQALSLLVEGRLSSHAIQLQATADKTQSAGWSPTAAGARTPGAAACAKRWSRRRSTCA
jgi:autotransporter translocation and assembly factor TamB